MTGASPRARGLNSADVLSMTAENHDYIRLRAAQSISLAEGEAEITQVLATARQRGTGTRDGPARPCGMAKIRRRDGNSFEWNLKKI